MVQRFNPEALHIDPGVLEARNLTTPPDPISIVGELHLNLEGRHQTMSAHFKVDHEIAVKPLRETTLHSFLEAMTDLCQKESLCTLEKGNPAREIARARTLKLWRK